MENQETDIQKYVQLLFDKGAKAIQLKKKIVPSKKDTEATGYP